MSQHTLFICTGCALTPEGDRPSQLLDQVLAADSAQVSGLTIEAVGCLWTCDRPCSASFTCPGKYTYHFVDLQPEQATDLLAFGAMYQSSENGYVKPLTLPETLQPKLLVRIPTPSV